MAEPGERRDAGALRLRKFIEVVVEDKRSFTLFRAAIAGISTSGMRVVSEQYCPRAPATRSPSSARRRCSLTGEVRWVRAFERDTFQVGVQFVGLSDEDQHRLGSRSSRSSGARPRRLERPPRGRGLHYELPNELIATSPRRSARHRG